MAHLLIGVAWPYASGPRHLGHAVSTFIPADVFARYHRMKGDAVLMVGGSDMHGTPTTVRADEEGVSPEVVANRYHEMHRQNIEALGVKYDLYWNTADPRHKEAVAGIFTRLRERGHLYEASMVSPFCPTCARFKPDRYIEGTCPHCGFDRARGDQCDHCGNLLDPFELKSPRCKTCGSGPEPRETKHFFFRLSAFQERLGQWLSEGKSHWRPPVLSAAKAWIAGGLKDRPVTRDIDWGVPVPAAGYESKRVYVWFEAVMGYLTASQEWARRSGEADKWREWWTDPAAKTYYFIGKDNVVFHTLFWPAILLGYDEGLILPHDVPATQYLNYAGEKMSAGRRIGIQLPELLETFDPDQIRYYGIATMPELRDADFSWAEFAAKNNSELLAVYGNFVHRALTFAAKNFENRVPEAGFLDGTDKAMLRNAEEQWKKVGQNLEYCHFRDALREAIQLARRGNQYFDAKAPWGLVKKDRAACGTALHVALRVSRSLAVILAPFLPFSSQRLWTALGYDTDVHAQSWESALNDLLAGQGLRVGKPLFAKIELEAEAPASEADRLDVRVAAIVEVRDHPNADKLYVLEVDLGDERRQIVAGIRANYAKEALRGRKIALLANLQPAKLRGVESNGMLLAGEDGDAVGLVLPPEDATPGTQVLGKKGAPRLSFDDFRKLRIVVDDGGKVFFLGTGTGRVALRAGDTELQVDKGIRDGSPVH